MTSSKIVFLNYKYRGSLKGCSVFYEGKLNDEILQEKIVGFYLTMDKDADLVVTPRPDLHLMVFHQTNSTVQSPLTYE